MIVDWTNPAERVAWLDREIAEDLLLLSRRVIPPEPNDPWLLYIADLRRLRQQIIDSMQKDGP